MNTLNKQWHLTHKMPKKPTIDERMKWHIEHAQYCACRKMSPKLQKEVAQWKKNEM